MAKQRASIQVSSDLCVWSESICASSATASDKYQQAFAYVVAFRNAIQSGAFMWAGVTHIIIPASKWEFYEHNPHAQDCALCRRIIARNAPIYFVRKARDYARRALGLHAECYLTRYQANPTLFDLVPQVADSGKNKKKRQ